jgi:hypothetical protein
LGPIQATDDITAVSVGPNHSFSLRPTEDVNRFSLRNVVLLVGAGDSVVVMALRYKPEGSGFETRRSEVLNLPNPSGLIRSCGLLSL